MENDLRYLYDSFRSCLTQNERIVFFEDASNRELMHQYDINVENLYNHHRNIFETVFNTTWTKKDIS